MDAHCFLELILLDFIILISLIDDTCTKKKRLFVFLMNLALFKTVLLWSNWSFPLLPFFFCLLRSAHDIH